MATLESTAGRDTHWSRASIAQRTGLSKSMIGRIRKKSDLKPHLEGSFKLSTDPQFVAEVVDVVGLYHHPPEKAVVLRVDEKSQIPALNRSQCVLPMMPGMPERRTHDYYRHGITSLFAALQSLTAPSYPNSTAVHQRTSRSSEPTPAAPVSVLIIPIG